MNTTHRLKDFPVSFFSIILGLFGLTIAWQRAGHLLRLGNGPGIVIFAGAVLLLGLITGLYLAKTIRHRPQVVEEFRDPVRINFFPIWAKLFLLGAIIMTGFAAPGLSRVLWITGTVMQFLFTTAILSAWMHKPDFRLHHINPALFIPIVGNIIVPIAGVEHAPAEVSWFFFSIGLVLWIVFMTLVFYRVIFHDPLPEKLVPTLFILMAPPAIGFISYVKLTGGLDAFARILYYFSLFLFILLLAQGRRFLKLRFFLSSWAYSFPLAAFTIASFFMYHKSGIVFFKYIAAGALALLTLLVLLLAVRTLAAVRNKEICTAEE